MATKVKGFCKGIKINISHLFGKLLDCVKLLDFVENGDWVYPSLYVYDMAVVKEREMEIGFPTDVKHVAHIGLDGSDGSAPSWMNDFKASSESALSSVGSSMRRSKAGSILSGSSSRDPTWASQDFDQSLGRQKAPDMLNNFPPTSLPNAPKKQKIPKRKKGKTSSSSSSKKSSSSPKSISSPNSNSNSHSSRFSRSSRKSTLGMETDNAEM